MFFQKISEFVFAKIQQFFKIQRDFLVNFSKSKVSAFKKLVIVKNLRNFAVLIDGVSFKNFKRKE